MKKLSFKDPAIRLFVCLGVAAVAMAPIFIAAKLEYYGPTQSALKFFEGVSAIVIGVSMFGALVEAGKIIGGYKSRGGPQSPPLD